MNEPGPGTKRSPEDIAEEIINQSDEGLDDLLNGTEVEDEDDYDLDVEPLALDEVFGDDAFSSDDEDF